MFLVPYGDDVPRKTFPFVNLCFVAANIAAFAILAARPDYGRIVDVHGFVPGAWTASSLLTSMFLHAGVMHLAGNMVFLLFLGDNVEDRYGHVGYFAFYFLCGLAATLAHHLLTPADMAGVPAIGASGAISGVLGAYLVLFPFHQIKLIVFVIPVRVHAVFAIGGWAVMQGFMAWRGPAEGVIRVAVWAHLGGFAFGLLLTLIQRMRGRRASRA